MIYLKLDSNVSRLAYASRDASIDVSIYKSFYDKLYDYINNNIYKSSG